jgi:hypothetical protein
VKIKLIKAKHPHFHLYLKGEELFVWSVAKKELYGFEGLSAAVFLYMDEFYTKQTAENVYHYFDGVSQATLRPLVEQIATILDDVTPSHNIEEQSDSELKSLKSAHSFTHSYHLQLNEECFLLELEDATLNSLVMPSLEHLETSNTRSDFIISVINDGSSGYEIYVNGILEDSVYNAKNLLPVLYDRIRIYHYQKNSFLVALHAAVLTYNDTALIFPGVSGAGKSTLGAYLMYKDFTLFSDELTIIDEKGTLTPLPLGVTLKEGSWHIVEPFVEDMESVSSHLRFDGQKIKLIVPPKIEHKKLQAKKFVFVFPQFIQGSTTQLDRLPLIKALHLFIDAGYHLVDPDDSQKVFLWLELLSEAELYTLKYSNIEEAHSILKEVVS